MAGMRSSDGKIAAPPYTIGPYNWDQHIDFKKTMLNSSSRYTLTEEFNQRPGANASIAVTFNLDFEILGTNAAEADVTWATTVGGIELKTHGADNDQVIVLPHLDTNQTAWTNVKWGTENQVIWEAVVKTDSDVSTGVLLWAGLKLTNTPTVATDADQAFFRFSTDDADTNWEVNYSIGGTDTSVDSGVAVAASTVYYFRIEIDADRKAHFFINDKQVAVSTALTNDVDLIPYVGVQCLDATPSSQYLYLVKESISRIVYE